MESIIRDVQDLDELDRSALERVVGHQLNDTQRIIVNVVSLELAANETSDTASPTEVPAWWKIYEGLGDEEIDRLDAAIRERANMTRTFE